MTIRPAGPTGQHSDLGTPSEPAEREVVVIPDVTGSSLIATDPTDRGTLAAPAWQDPSRPVAERVSDLLARMTLEEKLAQLGSVWLSGAAADGDGVAPLQGEFTADMPPLRELIRHGLGHLTRVFGTRPLQPAEGIGELTRLQAEVISNNRFGIPAIAHEECLTGFAAFTATAFPTPLAWGASFDADLVREMAEAIGRSMRAAGIHQGLAPVLDVARDPRWGRVEETIGADPYLVGVLGSAYVLGLQSTGVHATLKHFVGYSGSRAGRNQAPVSVGPRELGDVFLPPFEMAIRNGGARSVMHSYADLDGVPPAADHALLTELLRGDLGFDGVVVSDYYGISFLEALHRVAGSPAQAAALALRAGVDVELPNVRCFGEPLKQAVRSGAVPESLVDRATGRVLRQKFELGLLDGAGAAGAAGAGGTPDFDPPANRDLARRLAERSIVLLANEAGALPLAAGGNYAVVGPLAADPLAFFGCYTFPRHVGHAHPEAGPGIPLLPLHAALRAELPDASFRYGRGCDVRGDDRSGLSEAVELARAADAVIAVLGDEAGLFGRGTSGEGCDATDLRLPGLQEELLSELIQTGTPVVLVLITGRPYALGAVAGGLAAAVQAFFPGQEGGRAIAGVLSGRVGPGGKLPMELPTAPGAFQPTYLAAPLGGRTDVSSVDPTPLFPFGHGLSYTTFAYSDLCVRPRGETVTGDVHSARIGTDGAAEVSCVIRNTGTRPGSEVVQLYLHDPVAQVARPVRWLAGFVRIELQPGAARRVTFGLHADRTSFHGVAGARVVEPGTIEVAVGSSSADLRLHGELELSGPERRPGADRVLSTTVVVTSP
jgi:beta-xylosidase